MIVQNDAQRRVEPLAVRSLGTLVDLEKVTNHRTCSARGERVSVEQTDIPRPSQMLTTYHRVDVSMSYILAPDLLHALRRKRANAYLLERAGRVVQDVQMERIVVELTFFRVCGVVVEYTGRDKGVGGI